LLGAGVAAGQSPPPESATSQSSTPSSQSAQPSSEATASEKKAVVKDCVAQQRANDPRMSEQAATKSCEEKIGKSPH
jgi:hypothetical protein